MMDEAPIKARLLAMAKEDSPRWYEQCSNDETDGKRVRKRNKGEDYEVKIMEGEHGSYEIVVTPKRQKIIPDPDDGMTYPNPHRTVGHESG